MIIIPQIPVIYCIKCIWVDWGIEFTDLIHECDDIGHVSSHFIKFVISKIKLWQLCKMTCHFWIEHNDISPYLSIYRKKELYIISNTKIIYSSLAVYLNITHFSIFCNTHKVFLLNFTCFFIEKIFELLLLSNFFM